MKLLPKDLSAKTQAHKYNARMNHDPNWGFLPVPYGHFGGPPSPSRTQCPGCGVFAAELIGSTGVGCPACYDVFPQFIGHGIWEQQGCLAHQGKGPNTDPNESRSQAYKNAILKAREEGRGEDVQVFHDLLRLLESEDV